MLSTVPAAIASSDWQSIRASYEAGRHAFRAGAEGTFTAHNPGLDWSLTFDEKGFTAASSSSDGTGNWTWGLELEGGGDFDELGSCFWGTQAEIFPSVPLSADASRSEPNLNTTNTLSIPRSPHLTEWFINDQRGLEQGWTLTAPAEIRLRVRGNLPATVSAQSISFGGQINYSGLKAWDAKGQAVPTHFEATPNGFAVCYDDTAATYPITIDPIAQQAYLKASNTGPNDRFGNSVAVSGDTIVVGAYVEQSNAVGINGDQANNSASGSGAAYVFVRTGNSWAQQAYLKASNSNAGDGFGVTVAISGDTIVVGAAYEQSNATGINGNQSDNSAASAGAAYIFVRTGSVWSQQAYLKASNTGASDRFGSAAAVSGDTVIIGAPYEQSNATGINGNQSNNSAARAGAAYIFVRTGSSWSQQAYLKASNTGSDDYFGFAVDISGDTVVVGAYGEDSSAIGVNGDGSNNSTNASGAAYVFTRTGSSWSQQAYLKASNTDATDYFGISCAVSNDTVVVGAVREASNATGINGNQMDNSALYAGAAYVFVRSGTSWSQQAYLKASNTGPDSFAQTVAVSGDIVVIGAPSEASIANGVNGDQSDNTLPTSGAVYVFARSGSSWTQRAYLKASNSGLQDHPLNFEEQDKFGSSLSISGDTIVIGSPLEDGNAIGVNGNQFNNSVFESGAAYVFTGFITTAANYAAWAAANIPSGQNAAFNADWNRDGTPNGVQYVLGSTPFGITGRGKVPAPTTIPTDVNVFLDRSLTLAATSWSPAVSWVNGAAPAFASGVSIVGAEIRDTIAGPRAYYRYRVVQR